MRKQITHTIVFSLACILLFSFTSCNKGTEPGDTTEATVENMPTKVMVEIPDSLEDGTAATAPFVGAPLLADAAEQGETERAYEKMRTMVADMKERLAETAVTFALIDTLIGGLTPSTNWYPATNIVPDDDVIAKAKNVAPNAKNDMTRTRFARGIRIHPYTYNVAPAEETNFDYYFQMNGGTNAEGGPAFKFQVWWNEAKTRARVRHSSDISNRFHEMVLTYNDDEKVSTLFFFAKGERELLGKVKKYSRMSKMIVGEKTGDTNKNGVFIKYSETGFLGMNTHSFDVLGFADDDGGRVAAKHSHRFLIVTNDETNMLAKTFKVVEVFNKDTGLTAVKVSRDGGRTWVVAQGFQNPDSVTAYKTEKEAAEGKQLDKKDMVEDIVEEYGRKDDVGFQSLKLEVTNATKESIYIAFNTNEIASLATHFTNIASTNSTTAQTAWGTLKPYLVGIAFGVEDGVIALEVWDKEKLPEPGREVFLHGIDTNTGLHTTNAIAVTLPQPPQ